MGKTEWIRCPICNNKTRLKMMENTILEHFSLIMSEMPQRKHHKYKGMEYDSDSERTRR